MDLYIKDLSRNCIVIYCKTYQIKRLVNRSNRYGSGCGSVGRPSAYVHRGTGFESVIGKILHRTYFTLEGKEIKKKRPGIDDFYPNKQKRFCAERKAFQLNCGQIVPKLNFWVYTLQKLGWLGRGGGQVVSVRPFYSDDPSSIPA